MVAIPKFLPHKQSADAIRHTHTRHGEHDRLPTTSTAARLKNPLFLPISITPYQQRPSAFYFALATHRPSCLVSCSFACAHITSAQQPRQIQSKTYSRTLLHFRTDAFSVLPRRPRPNTSLSPGFEHTLQNIRILLKRTRSPSQVPILGLRCTSIVEIQTNLFPVVDYIPLDGWMIKEVVVHLNNIQSSDRDAVE